MNAGERISIDGGTGEIFLGELPGSWEVAPEAATVLAWAAELGIEIDRPSDEGSSAGRHAAAAGQALVEAIGPRDVVRALAVKGVTSPEHLAEILLGEPEAASPMVELLVEDGLAERTGDLVRLTAVGKLEASAAFEVDRASLGEPRSVDLLGAFHAFDVRMKELVTAWQVRDVAGQQVLNDHTDAAYDAQVVEELGSLHRDMIEWLSSPAGAMRPFAVYRSRLMRALERVRSGDQRYVASPRVDSYHSVWFELHEDLIRLAGRRRSDEAAAGRA